MLDQNEGTSRSKNFKIFHIDELRCQQCTSNDRNSNCKNGNSTNIVSCPDDKQSCFAEEYIGENGNHVYQRGCSASDKCNSEARKLGASLKYCRVCNGCDNCNNKPTKPVQNISCQRCASEDPNSACRNGTIKEKFQCPSDEPACYTEDILNEGRPPYYRRGCAPVDWCETQKNSHAEL
ncbi:hypothetical protein WA026_000576 [Henosepilachna vigintioctopunctata]|uniref:UPAR/Ly6 domain-containing protein n=1 Tax=Henosepilachna vigintioctopunctata TaxID=420089 RepID=A0AAW1V7Z3_9CUCU